MIEITDYMLEYCENRRSIWNKIALPSLSDNNINQVYDSFNQIDRGLFNLIFSDSDFFFSAEKDLFGSSPIPEINISPIKGVGFLHLEYLEHLPNGNCIIHEKRKLSGERTRLNFIKFQDYSNMGFMHCSRVLCQMAFCEERNLIGEKFLVPTREAEFLYDSLENK